MSHNNLSLPLSISLKSHRIDWCWWKGLFWDGRTSFHVKTRMEAAAFARSDLH